MLHVNGSMVEIHPTKDPLWEEDRDGYFKTGWMLVRNKTKNIKFARTYLGDYGSNQSGDLTITWNPSGLFTIA
jgi:hypothetical protein